MLMLSNDFENIKKGSEVVITNDTGVVVILSLCVCACVFVLSGKTPALYVCLYFKHTIKDTDCGCDVVLLFAKAKSRKRWSGLLLLVLVCTVISWAIAHECLVIYMVAFVRRYSSAATLQGQKDHAMNAPRRSWARRKKTFENI